MVYWDWSVVWERNCGFKVSRPSLRPLKPADPMVLELAGERCYRLIMNEKDAREVCCSGVAVSGGAVYPDPLLLSRMATARAERAGPRVAYSQP